MPRRIDSDAAEMARMQGRDPKQVKKWLRRKPGDPLVGPGKPRKPGSGRVAPGKKPKKNTRPLVRPKPGQPPAPGKGPALPASGQSGAPPKGPSSTTPQISKPLPKAPPPKPKGVHPSVQATLDRRKKGLPAQARPTGKPGRATRANPGIRPAPRPAVSAAPTPTAPSRPAPTPAKPPGPAAPPAPRPKPSRSMEKPSAPTGPKRPAVKPAPVPPPAGGAEKPIVAQPVPKQPAASPDQLDPGRRRQYDALVKRLNSSNPRVQQIAQQQLQERFPQLAGQEASGPAPAVAPLPGQGFVPAQPGFPGGAPTGPMTSPPLPGGTPGGMVRPLPPAPPMGNVQPLPSQPAAAGGGQTGIPEVDQLGSQLQNPQRRAQFNGLMQRYMQGDQLAMGEIQAKFPQLAQQLGGGEAQPVFMPAGGNPYAGGLGSPMGVLPGGQIGHVSPGMAPDRNPLPLPPPPGGYRL